MSRLWAQRKKEGERKKEMCHFLFCGDFRLEDHRRIRSVIDADGSGRWVTRGGGRAADPGHFARGDSVAR